MTLPSVLALADGLPAALAGRAELVKGVNVAAGSLTHPEVAAALGQEYVPVSEALGLAA